MGTSRFCFEVGPIAERYRSGQTGQTVNLLAIAFGGSNPPLSTMVGRSIGFSTYDGSDWERFLGLGVVRGFGRE